MYEIIYLEEVAKKHIPNLAKTAKEYIKKSIETKLMTDPVGFGKPLRYAFKGYRTLRVADYRVIYRIDPYKMQVTVVAIKHRKDVYEN